MSIRNRFGVSVFTSSCSAFTIDRCIRKTLRISITPVPSAASTAADWFPGRYRFASPCRSAECKCNRVRDKKARSVRSVTAESPRMNTSSPARQIANHFPTSIESASAAAISPSPAKITTTDASCSLCSFSHPIQPLPSPDSTIRRSTKLGRTFLTSSSGGKQNSSVVSIPVPSAASTGLSGSRISGRSGSSLPSTVGKAYSTPSPSTTPINAPNTPRNSVCIK